MWESIPLDIFLNVIAYVTPADLNACRLVCCEWLALADHGSSWAVKSRQRWRVTRIPLYWKTYYIVKSKHKNLFTNPCAQYGLQGWITKTTSFSKWYANGCGPKGISAWPTLWTPKYFVSLFGSALLFQTVDLYKHGYGPALDTAQSAVEGAARFDVRVSFDCFAAQPRCKYVYQIELLSADMCTLDWYSGEYRFWKYANPYGWQRVSHLFQCVDGLRYVSLTHWASSPRDKYGVKIRNHVMNVTYPEDAYAEAPVPGLGATDYVRSRARMPCVACGAAGCQRHECNAAKCRHALRRTALDALTTVCTGRRAARDGSCACDQCASCKCRGNGTPSCECAECVNVKYYYKTCDGGDYDHADCTRCACRDADCVRCRHARNILSSKQSPKCYNLNCYYVLEMRAG
ncbi:putative F-box-containing protein [Namao virus]|nr:putative F-box-containing protein [Namao virus]